MLIICIKTDQTLAEITLFDDLVQKGQLCWEAHRTLADTIHLNLTKLLNDCGYTLEQINGLLCFKGPGSFTGLRIGLSVANALAYVLNIPILGSGGENWKMSGLKRLIAGDNEKIILPEYGGQANTTKPKK